MEKFDTELLIDLVKQHPALWDSNCEEYRERTEKPKIWREIALTMYPTLEGSNLEAASTFVSKKWKNLKDNYVRSLRNKHLTGKQSKIYIYTDAMSFLNLSEEEIANEYNSINGSAVATLLKLETSGGETKFKTVQTSAGGLTTKPGVKRKLANLSSPIITRLQPVAVGPNQSKLEEKLLQFFDKLEKISKPDEDQSFFNSILPAVKEFDLDQKLEFRSKVLTLVQTIRKK